MCAKRILLVLVISSFASFAAEDHETKAPPSGGKRGTNNTRPETTSECRVRPGDIADFANGDSYNFKSMVSFITQPSCISQNRVIGQQAMAQGVTFNSMPLRLETHSKNFSKMTLEGVKQLETTLLTTVPATLREHPMTTAELLPIVGQLAILSPQASKAVLTIAIEQELIAADDILKRKSASPKDVAKTLLRMGAAEGVIAAELANDIEEKAVMAQAESLAKIFQTLAIVAQAEAALMPTFNISASALNRGVQKGKKMYQPGDRQSLLMTLFEAIRASSVETAGMEPGKHDLNEALQALLTGSKNEKELVKKVWDEALKILAQTQSQSGLAKAVALVLSKNVAYLPKGELERLLAACRNYPELAHMVQERFLEALEEAWEELHEGDRTIASFNVAKRKFFEPFVAKALDLEPPLVDPIWLQSVLKRGLVSDADVEKKFPRLVLSLMDRRDKAGKVAAMEERLDTVMTAMAENLAVIVTLNRVHLPALNRWIDRYEEPSDENAKPAQEAETSSSSQ